MKVKCNIYLICLILSICYGVSAQDLPTDSDIQNTNVSRRDYVRNNLFTNTPDRQINQSFKRDSNMTVLGRWAQGRCMATFVTDHTVYFGNGCTMEVVDFSNPEAPVRIGKIVTPSIIQGIYVSGNMAYLANWEAGLRIVDVSVPVNPVEVGFFDTGSCADGIFVSDNYAYVTDWYDGLRIIDVSTPTSPSEVGFYLTDDIAFDVHVSGNYAYLAANEGGLRIIDISVPANPVEVGFINTLGEAGDVYIYENYAFIADWDNGTRIIDITDPMIPFEVGSIGTGTVAAGVCVSAGHAYIAEYSYGMSIYDISDPSNPSQVDFLYWDIGFSWEISISDGYLSAAVNHAGMKLYDIAAPDDLNRIGAFETAGEVSGIFVAGDYAYLADGYDGLKILNISNSSIPREVGAYEFLLHGGTNGSAGAIHVDGDYACIADRAFSRYRKLNISNPNSPNSIAAISMNGGVNDVFISGQVVYLAQNWNGLGILTLETSNEVGHFYTDYALGVCVSGNYAYVADGEAGLRIIDISNPAAPAEAGSFDTGDMAINVFVAGNLAYVADGEDGLRIIDIQNPAQPAEVGFYETDGYAIAVYVSDNYAYVADDVAGLRLIDVNDPVNPKEVGFFDTGWYAVDVFVRNHIAYVADGAGGLYILQNDLETGILPENTEIVRNFSLDQNYPNPFNPSTTIQFRIPRSEYVTLRVYNILGQEVIRLSDQKLNAGIHQVRFDGGGLAAGIYTYQLVAGDFREVKKMILLR